MADVTRTRSLAAAVNEAEVQRLLDLEQLHAALDRLPGRRGAGRLNQVLETYAPEPRFMRSEAERRFVRMCKEHGLPAPQTNLWIVGQEVDAYWPDARLAVEIDSRTFHLTRHAFEEDRRRDRSLAAAGVQVARVTTRDLEDEGSVAAELAAIRARRLRGG